MSAISNPVMNIHRKFDPFGKESLFFFGSLASTVALIEFCIFEQL